MWDWATLHCSSKFAFNILHCLAGLQWQLSSHQGEGLKIQISTLFYELPLRWVDVLNPATNQLVTKVPQSTQQVFLSHFLCPLPTFLFIQFTAPSCNSSCLAFPLNGRIVGPDLKYSSVPSPHFFLFFIWHTFNFHCPWAAESWFIIISAKSRGVGLSHIVFFI